MGTLRRIASRTVRLVRLTLGVALAVPLRVLSPVLRIEIQYQWSERIGHLAIEPELYMCKRRSTPVKRCRTYFYFKTPHANDFLVGKWQSLLPTGPAWLLSLLFEAYERFSWLDLGARHWEQAHDDLRAIDGFKPSIGFTAGEEERGRQLLADLGIPAGVPYVCLAVRDSAYLAMTAPQKDWSYHDYRDSNIETYIMMSEWLANAGYAVVRMGAIVKEPLVSSHPLVIDYATSGLRSDFGDVYLFAHCAFCISTATGMDSLAMLFRRPLGIVNLPVIGGMQLGGPLRLVMFKDLVDVATGARVSMTDPRRSAAMRLFRTEAFAEMDIDLVDNTPEELLDFAQEMVAITTVGLKADSQIEARGRTLVRELTDDRRLDDADFRVSPAWLGRQRDR